MAGVIAAESAAAANRGGNAQPLSLSSPKALITIALLAGVLILIAVRLLH